MRVTKKEQIWQERYDSVKMEDVDWPSSKAMKAYQPYALAAILWVDFTLHADQVDDFELMRKCQENVMEFMRRRYFALGYQKGQADAKEKTRVKKLKKTDTEQ